MPNPDMTSSAALHLRMGAFGVMFTVLAVYFDPQTAVLLSFVASTHLAKL
jgi:hypothetical protein